MKERARKILKKRREISQSKDRVEGGEGDRYLAMSRPCKVDHIDYK
jgi:hypothetical protein